MRVRWTVKAAEDPTRIVTRIRQDNPAAAQRVVQTIFEGISALRRFPNRGRTGVVSGTRELVFALGPILLFTKSPEITSRYFAYAILRGNWP